MGFGWVVGLSELSGSSPDSGLWIRGIIHSTHLMLLVDGVTLMELTRGPISQHSWFTWWSGFELDFRVFGFLKFGTRSRLVDQGDTSQHLSDAFGRPGNSSGVYSWPVRDIYGSHGGRDFCRILDFWNPQVGVQAFGLSTRGGHPHTDGCGPTVSTAFARKPWLAVYRAHSDS